MDLSEVLEPVVLNDYDDVHFNVQTVSSYGDSLLVSADAFLIGYSEDRNSNNVGVSAGTNAIRRSLYRLFQTSKPMMIIDVGNCVKGASVDDSYKNLEFCVNQLALYGKPIIVFGGTQEALSPVLKAGIGRVAYPAVCLVDSQIDWAEDDVFTNQTYIQKIVDACPLLRVVFVGIQEYLSSREAYKLIRENNYSYIRLGDCNTLISNLEPLVRDAQIVSLDMNAVRYSDNPAGANVNGLYSEQICQVAWYAGYSPRMNVFHLSEYNPSKDNAEISEKLAGQILWHVLDGISQRKNESCDFSDDDMYLKRYLKHPMFPQDICFYESLIAQTMWVEVPIGSTGRKRIIPCSRKDYESFENGVVPELWMTEFNRLSNMD